MINILGQIEVKGSQAPVSEELGWLEGSVEWARALLSQVSEVAWVQAAISIGVFLVLAKVVDLLITVAFKVLSRRTKNALDDRLLELLHKPVLRSVALFGVLVTMAILGPDEATALLLTRLISCLILLVWTVFLLRATKIFLLAASTHGARFQAIEPRTFPLFSNLATVLILAVATWCLIRIWGADMSGWLASAGVAGLAIGFAAKDTLANLFAGVFVIADAPFRVGDYIVLDTGDRGRVVHIGLRSTRLLTRDDVEITIPNAVIAGGRITNQSSGPSMRMRVKVPLQVAYGTDVEQLRGILMDIAETEPLAEADPTPRVRFRLLADSGLNFELMVWVNEPSLRGRAVDALNTAIYQQLASAKIEIPYPKRDLYVHQQ